MGQITVRDYIIDKQTNCKLCDIDYSQAQIISKSLDSAINLIKHSILKHISLLLIQIFISALRNKFNYAVNSCTCFRDN